MLPKVKPIRSVNRSFKSYNFLLKQLSIKLIIFKIFRCFDIFSSSYIHASMVEIGRWLHIVEKFQIQTLVETIFFVINSLQCFKIIGIIIKIDRWFIILLSKLYRTAFSRLIMCVRRVVWRIGKCTLNSRRTIRQNLALIICDAFLYIWFIHRFSLTYCWYGNIEIY